MENNPELEASMERGRIQEENLKRMVEETRLRNEKDSEQKRLNTIFLENWSKNKWGHYICNKEKPMPLDMKKDGRWEHDDVHETDYDGEYSIEWKCNSCGHIFRTEMPD